MVEIVEAKKNQEGGKPAPKLEKQLMLAELEQAFRSGQNAIFSRFDRLNVYDVSELRRNLEKFSRRTLMVKHSLTKRVLQAVQLGEAEQFLDGATLVTFSEGEPQAVSKALIDFAKSHENLRLKGMIFEGKVFGESFVKQLAGLPSRKELLTILAVRMKSPIAGLAMTLKGLIRSFVIALNEVQKKKNG